MQTDSQKLVLATKDYQFLRSNIGNNNAMARETENSSLLGQLAEAEVLEESEFPWEVARLNSKVIIRDKQSRLNYTYTIVLPDEADHRKCNVSIFSPIGSALFGHRRGEDIFWQTPKGKRYFTIMAISQPVG